MNDINDMSAAKIYDQNGIPMASPISLPSGFPVFHGLPNLPSWVSSNARDMGNKP